MAKSNPVVDKFLEAEIDRVGIHFVNMSEVIKALAEVGISAPIIYKSNAYDIIRKGRRDHHRRTPPAVPDRPPTLDVKTIRTRSGLTQAAFAERFGLNIAALRQWETGRRQPETTAKMLIQLIDTHPYLVDDTVARLHALEHPKPADKETLERHRRLIDVMWADKERDARDTDTR